MQYVVVGVVGLWSRTGRRELQILNVTFVIHRLRRTSGSVIASSTYNGDVPSEEEELEKAVAKAVGK